MVVKNNTTGSWKSFCISMLTVISTTGIRTPRHSRTLTTAKYGVLQTLFHLIWSSIMQSTVCSETICNAVAHRDGFLATLQHSIDCARASLHLTHGHNKRMFNRRLCNGRENIKTGDFAGFDIRESGTKTLKLRHAVKEPCRVWGVPTQRGHPTLKAGWTDWNWQDRMHPSASWLVIDRVRFRLTDIHMKQEFESKTLIVLRNHGILKHYLLYHGQLKFLPNYGPNIEATCGPSNGMPNNIVFRYFAHMHKNMPDPYI